MAVILAPMLAARMTTMLGEDPARRSTRLRSARSRTTFSCATVAVVALWVGTTHVRAQIRPAGRDIDAPVAQPPSCFGAASRDPLHPCENHALRLQVVPSPVAARDEENAPCNDFRREGGVNVCSFGLPPDQVTRTVALVGDSHASHWRAPLNVVAHEQGWRGLSVTRKSCPFSKATKLTLEPTRAHCVSWVEALPAFFGAHPEIDTMFVVALAGGKVNVPAGRTTLEARVNGYRNAWEALPETVRHIVVIRDTPRMSRRTGACVARSIADREPAGVACARPRAQALRTDPQAVAAREAHSPRLQVIDLTSVLCSRRLCFPVIGGALVYKDLHHLSRVFAETLAPALGREVRRAERSW